MKRVLKENAFAGDKIQKERIPSVCVRKHGIHNLYRYEHPEGYRSCCTCLNDGSGLLGGCSGPADPQGVRKGLRLLNGDAGFEEFAQLRVVDAGVYDSGAVESYLA